MGSTVLWITQHHLRQTVEQRVAAGFQRIQSSQKGSSEVQISQETKGRVLSLRTVCLELSDLLWHVSPPVFSPQALPWSVARPGVPALALAARAGCLHMQTEELHHGNTATCCIHVVEKGGNKAICCESI